MYATLLELKMCSGIQSFKSSVVARARKDVELGRVIVVRMFCTYPRVPTKISRTPKFQTHFCRLPRNGRFPQIPRSSMHCRSEPRFTSDLYLNSHSRPLPATSSICSALPSVFSPCRRQPLHHRVCSVRHCPYAGPRVERHCTVAFLHLPSSPQYSLRYRRLPRQYVSLKQ